MSYRPSLIKSPVSWMGNKAPILPIIYSLFPLEYGRFVEVFRGSGSVLLGSRLTLSRCITTSTKPSQICFTV